MFIRKLLLSIFARKNISIAATEAELSEARLNAARKWLNERQPGIKRPATFEEKRQPDMLDDAHDPTQAHLPFNIFNREKK